MTHYLYLYFGGATPGTPEARQALTSAWMDYFQHLGDRVIDAGAPTGQHHSLSGAPASHITGYSVIAAESLDEAVALTEGHPHIAHGGAIEVLETLPTAMNDPEDEDDDEDEDEDEDEDMNAHA